MILPRAQLGGLSSPLSPSAPDVNEAERLPSLVRGLREGDPAAAAVLFDHYSASIHRLLIRIVGASDPESRDLLHDTFVRAFENVRSLKNPRALRGWLMGIAVFTAQEWLRTRKRIGQPQSPDSEVERPAPGVQPEARQAVRAFYDILDTFPEEERTVFVLRFVERMDWAEIADACRISMSTARRRSRRAQGRFQAALPSYPALHEHLEPRK